MLAFLTDYEHNPAYISKYLVERGWPTETKAYAAEHISYENQHIAGDTLGDLTELDGFGESVLVVIG